MQSPPTQVRLPISNPVSVNLSEPEPDPRPAVDAMPCTRILSPVRGAPLSGIVTPRSGGTVPSSLIPASRIPRSDEVATSPTGVPRSVAVASVPVGRSPVAAASRPRASAAMTAASRARNTQSSLAHPSSASVASATLRSVGFKVFPRGSARRHRAGATPMAAARRAPCRANAPRRTTSTHPRWRRHRARARCSCRR